jgi:superfamily II DNA or RNA helicase
MLRTLRDYQYDAVRFLARHIYNGQQTVALTSPTGSGKTLVAQFLLETLLATDRFSRALVVAPQVQIEEGFIPNGGDRIQAPASKAGYIHVSPEVTVKQGGHGWVQCRTSRTSPQKFLSANVPRHKVVVTTHSAVARWHRAEGFLPADLKGCILLVDETHRASLKNQVGAVTTEWERLGGTVIHMTATPFRTDGDILLPNDIPRYPRTIAEHALGGIYAPEKMRLRTRALRLNAESHEELTGDKQAHGDVQASCSDLVSLWKSDGKPKTVIIVPSRGDSGKWASTLMGMLKAAGARVFNAIGTAGGRQTELALLLKKERTVTSYKDSSLDVVLACKRFDEGTDWPLCSHIYNVGLPRAFNLILQRWGRAMRPKRGIKGYPKAHRDLALMTFFVPHVSDAVWAKFEGHHKDHVFLLACYMEDSETAQQYRGALRWRPEDVGRQRSGRTRQSLDDLLADLDSEVQKVTQADTDAEALLKTAQAEALIRDHGKEPTLSAVLDHMENTMKLPDEELQKVKAYWAVKALLDPKAKAIQQSLLQRLTARIKNGDTSVPLSIIQTEMRVAFDEVIKEHAGSTVIDLAESVSERTSQFSGRDAKVVAQDLRDRVPAIHLSLEQIKEGILRYKNAKGGPPTVLGGDAAPYFGFPITWNTINNILRRHWGSRLFDLCVELGLRDRFRVLSLEEIRKGIRKYQEKHGVCPPAKGGDASVYFGTPITWSALTTRLWCQGSSIPILCSDMGLTAPLGMTLDRAKALIRKHHAKTGKVPTKRSTPPPDTPYPFTWVMLEGRLISMGTSIYKLCIDMGLRAPSPKDLPPSTVKEALKKYYAEKGSRPSGHSLEDAAPYFGYPITWNSIEQRLQRLFGTSIMDLCDEMGIRQTEKTYVRVTAKQIDQDLRAFFLRKGRPPLKKENTVLVGGTGRTWGGNNHHLKKLTGKTLLQRSAELGFIAPTDPRIRKGCPAKKLELNTIEAGIRRYRRKYGVCPLPKSGGAAPFFGDGVTWCSLNNYLAGMGTSLSKLCVSMGLKGPRKALSKDQVVTGIREYYTKHQVEPTTSSGDASPIFDKPISWASINSSLRYRYGTSLAKLKAEMWANGELP